MTSTFPAEPSVTDPTPIPDADALLRRFLHPRTHGYDTQAPDVQACPYTESDRPR